MLEAEPASHADLAALGFVRPRYDDGTFDEPLPLEDCVRERVLGPDPTRLLLLGPRGSGLTTALAYCRRLVVQAGLEPVDLDDLCPPAAMTSRARVDRAWELLARRAGVLLLDCSLLPHGPAGLARAERIFSADQLGRRGSAEVLRHARAIVAGHAARGPAARAPHDDVGETTVPVWLGGVARTGVQTADNLAAWLAPWTWDDLVELLAAPRWREARGRVLAALKAVPAVAPLIGRPWTALRLLEAAAELGPDEPRTLGRLYANVLDRLEAPTLEVLRALPERWSTRDLLRLIPEQVAASGQTPRELLDLFELQDELVSALHARQPVERLLAREAHAVPGRRLSHLALPGLHDLLQAGECVEGIGRDEAPAAVRRSWLPYLPELVGPTIVDRLRGWLAGVDLSGVTGPARHAPAATILHACGITPPLQGDGRVLALAGALLDGLVLPGARLATTVLGDASLVGARLAGCDLSRSIAAGADLRRAGLEGANLAEVRLQRTRLEDAVLAGATLRKAHLHVCDLRGADLTGADVRLASMALSDLRAADLTGASLLKATLEGCRLERASLARATLRGALLTAGKADGPPAADLASCEGLDLREADLTEATLVQLDVRQARFAPRSLALATLRACLLTELDLDELEAPRVQLHACDLTDATLRGAALERATIDGCRAHGLVLDGADLRASTWRSCDFQAGSSRAGLLLGKPALEGTMTGYYAEGSTDDAWTPPEAIRSASFRGCDLRGSRFIDCDLSRVDLRGAALDPPLRDLARKHGAILDDV
jgi:uncharacterized protein YjbI with pentapeptide repeats